MVGFPKIIKTKSDLKNTFKLVKRGRLKAEDWLAAVAKLEAQNYITCPIVEKSEDCKVVTLMFCNEVAEGAKVICGNLTRTVNAVENVEVELTEEEAAANKTPTTHTILTLSGAVASGATEISIPAAVTFYDRLGITEEEVEAMKGELA